MMWRPSRSWIAILLWLSTAAIYLPTVGYGFVPWDDPEYVAGNHRLVDGLTAHGLARTITEPYYANWTPLTTLSYSVDFRLYRQWAGGYHLTNLLLHALATSLLFLSLAHMTGALGRSAAVAAVFGLHPLHVEAVAWVSQRKDVLSGVFFMATLWTYVRYATRPTAARYAAVAGCLALGLVSKPMLVTTPFVLLLLDFWPLRRLDPENLRGVLWAGSRCLLEKLPLFILAGVIAWISYRVQESAGSVASLAEVPLAARLMNIPLAYVWYLEKTFWPRGLAFFYPLVLVSGALSVTDAGLALVGLLAVTVLVFALLKRAPYLAVGWLWYLGMLVPVIGLVQAGAQAHADRYAYLPQIGVVIAVTWGVHALGRYVQASTRGLAIATATILAGLIAVTSRQIPVWRNGVTLGERALLAAPPTAAAHVVLATGLIELGHYTEAHRHAEIAAQLSPLAASPRYVLGNVMALEGNREEAVSQYRLALRLEPQLEVARIALGRLLTDQGRNAEALALLSQSVANDSKVGQEQAHLAIGRALVAQGKLAEAIDQYRLAVQMQPDFASAQGNLGLALTQTGHFVEGEEHLRRAIELAPDTAEVHGALAENLQRQGRQSEAIAQWRESLRLMPDQLEAMNNLAWLLATAEDPAARRPSEAVALAERAAAITASSNASVLDTLAAAYAAAGRREEAARTARRAIELARQSGDAALAKEINERLTGYEGAAGSSP
jgi:tetratricopeptide (TPR) repeat protein